MSNPASAPRTSDEVQARYRDLRAQHQGGYDALATRRGNSLKLLAVVLAVIVFEALRSPHGGTGAWLYLAGFALVAGAIWYALRQQTSLTRRQRLLSFYDRSLLRIDGAQPQASRAPSDGEGKTGQELRPEGHLYEHDLDLLGPDSLFALLSTVRTGPGERGLAQYLLEPASHAETLLRQAAVQELLPQTSLREEIALLGTSSFQQISAGFFDEWLDDVPPVFHPAWRVALILTATLDIALIVAGLMHLRPWGFLLPNIALVLAVQAAISFYLRGRVLPLLKASVRLQQHIKLISDGLALMQSATFVCPKLRELQRLSLEPAGAVKLLKRLDSHLALVEQRTKEYFYILSLLLAAGTQAAMAIARWKQRNVPAMRLWLAAWSEFEALNALATYAFEHPEDCWPELLPDTHPPLYEATALGHPLLPAAVTNDITLGARNRFLLISGSNMAGKSTLLRSIGINAVLAYAGAPVRARALRVTPLALGASLALTDSLTEGRSKFLAEVERLSAIARLSASTPLLFLVDEIFSGTNSADRGTAAAAVLHRLLANGAIGALSTHDLALTGLATADNAGLNVHMASPDPEDPLAFDYKLKPGVNTTSNALAIVRMMGL